MASQNKLTEYDLPIYSAMLLILVALSGTLSAGEAQQPARHSRKT